MRVRKIGFIIATVLLIGVIGFCIGGTVKGEESGADQIPESWYRRKEAELLEDTRGYLDNLGYRNSGVTLTRVVDAEGNRAYTFTIHHARIDRMQEEKRQELQGELARIGLQRRDVFPEEICSFQYDFLILENDLQ